MKILLSVLVTLVFISTASLHAVEVDPDFVSYQDVERNVEEVLEVLDEHYVYPEIAKEMREFVSQEMSDGRYQEIRSQEALITKLQADLRKISRDGHISLHLAKNAIDRSSHILPPTKLDQEFFAGLVSDKTDRSKIGYLRFNKFGGDANTKERIVAAMKELEETDSLIIDLRDNIGGDPNLVAFLSAYFLDSNTHLWSILDREGNTMIKVNSTEQALSYQGEVCLLTSNKTYSAAEAFAYTLKHLDRACIIGEATGGGAHLVQMEQVNDEMDIRIPVARAYNPITKSNWEGIGVVPTIEIDPSQAKSAAIEYFRNRNK